MDGFVGGGQHRRKRGSVAEGKPVGNHVRLNDDAGFLGCHCASSLLPYLHVTDKESANESPIVVQIG